MCRVCVRREKSYCTVTWTSTKFSVSASPLPLQPSALSGDIACSYDWIAFPGQSSEMEKQNEEFCVRLRLFHEVFTELVLRMHV